LRLLYTIATLTARALVRFGKTSRALEVEDSAMVVILFCIIKVPLLTMHVLVSQPILGLHDDLCHLTGLSLLHSAVIVSVLQVVSCSGLQVAQDLLTSRA
jgi:hypothetical protein